jgi:DNA recombination protein RmuC
MEFLAGLYTLLLVTICLLLAAVLWKLNKPRNGGDYEELKRWMQQQLDAQAKDFAASNGGAKLHRHPQRQ